MCKGLRYFVLAAATALTVAGAGGPVAAAPTGPPQEPVMVSLPAPTGPYSVGVTELPLIDPHRADPWDTGSRRELMIQIWYPAQVTDDSPTAPWMPPGGREAQEAYLETLGVPAGSWRLGSGHSHRNHPARTDTGRFPVLLYSPGMGDTTGWNTAQAEDLASHGYAVVAINHTHEAAAVHFPDGRVKHSEVPLDAPQEVLSDLLLPTRVADTRFVVDRLAAYATGTEVEPRLPDHLADTLDPTRVAMFGHSLGGSTTVQAVHDEPRIRAGVNLDGPVLGSVATEGTDRPLLFLAGGTSPWSGAPGWEPYWPNNTGPKIPLPIPDTEHMSFTDQQTILPQINAAGLLSTETEQKAVGTIDPDHSIDRQRSYLRVFFDLIFGRITTDLIATIADLAVPGDS